MRDEPSWPVFTAYAVAGAVFALGILSILTVGPFLLQDPPCNLLICVAK